MTQATVPSVDAAYRRRVADLRTRVNTLIAGEFRDQIDPGDIAGSFAAFLKGAVPTIESGQASAQELAAAYVANLAVVGASDFEPLEPAVQSVGTTSRGMALRDAMAAIGPMMLDQIKQGRSVAEAIDFGEYLTTRTADNEVTAAADEEADRQADASPDVLGWEGVVNPDACDGCQGNVGFHDLKTPIYRHPNCGCSKMFIINDRRVPEEDIKPIAEALVDFAAAEEPATTSLLQELGELFGGDINDGFEMPNGDVHHTLEAVLKTEDSTIRKIVTDMQLGGISAQEAAEGLYDNLRYTMTFDPDDLPEGMAGVSQQMADAGYKPVGIKNFWTMSDHGYAGFNAKWQTPDGQPFELQFHTGEALQVKESLAHPFFEVQRVSPPGSEAWIEADRAMDELWAPMRDELTEKLSAGFDDWAPTIFPDVRS